MDIENIGDNLVGRVNDRRSEATRNYWARYREAKNAENDRRRQMEERAERYRRMKAKCRDYDEQPLIEMTDQEAAAFALTMAESTADILRIRDKKKPLGWRTMKSTEKDQYAAVVLSSILYFNKKSEAHRRAMKYREECQRAEAERRLRMEAMQTKAKEIIISVK